MKFPGRSELKLSDPYASLARGENVTEAAEARLLEKQAHANASKLAIARYWLGEEVPREKVTPVGSTRRRFEVEGFDGHLRLSEAFLHGDDDPREHGIVAYFRDAQGGVHYLRGPYGSGGTGLSAAAHGGEVRGGMLISDDGKARRLG